MAELILTDEEKAAPLWSDLSDEALGKLVKNRIFKMVDVIKQADELNIFSASVMLAMLVEIMGGDSATVELRNLRVDVKDRSDWKIEVKRNSKDGV